MRGNEDPHSKTEQATPFKLEQARQKGMVARSLEVGALAAAAATLVYLWGYGADLAADVGTRTRHAISMAGSFGADPAALVAWTGLFAADLLALIAPWLLVVAAASLAAAFLQIGPVFAPGALKPDFSKLNPAAGFKRLFSAHTLVDAAKSCLKLAVLAILTWMLLEGAALGTGAGAVDARGVVLSMAKVSALWLLAYLGCAALFAAVDLQLVKRRFAKRMRMSRRDLRDELRHREGEPRIKQRRRQLAREMLERARNLRSVRGADIVVTNPTHFAVALRYDPRTMVSPCVVAKGAGEFAQRMRRVAFVYGVPCFEQPPLARELYRHLRVEQHVPARLYGSVAALYLQLRRRPGQAAAAQAGASAG